MSTLAALGASARLSRLVLNRLGVPQLSAGLMTCSDESHALPSSSGRMTASPSTPCAMAPGLSGFAMPWGGDSPNSLVPQLCATPKKKLSPHRRGNRRVWYWLKRKPEFAKCSFCGALAGRSTLFSGAAGNSQCTGQCVALPPPSSPSQREPEYQPPC